MPNAANDLLNIYKDDPTAGSTDGTLVTESDPITAVLNASQNESKVIKLALRCESGYRVEQGEVTMITKTNDTSERWKFSADGNNWSNMLALEDAIGTTNYIFYVKASSDSSEYPQNDTSVTVTVTALIGAV